MTKGFYISFLNYISPKELKRLYSYLSRQKLSVKGFPPNKTPPTTMLAPQISKNEKVFFDVLEAFYIPSFDNCDAAAHSFAPDTAVTCLAYFVKSGMTNEPFLLSLLEKKDAAQEETQLSPETGRSKKKSGEFREKYLSTRRELLQLRKDYEKIQAENTGLKSELLEQRDKLGLAEETLRHFEEESATTIHQLKSRVRELENIIIEHQPINTVQTVSILVIMDTDRTDDLGIDILTYDNISKLFELADQYDEILLVINDLPFSVIRKIHKIDTIQEKLIKFSTKQEMLEYAKQRRNR
ncbi:MAG: hypothetical protein HFG28_13385 [Eubacterium sp.]|nr:hypothetical protein [Eubacterium sp.]